jgi:polyisoprenoid-binding protein YceI
MIRRPATRLLTALALSALALGPAAAAEELPPPSDAPLPAGTYRLDPAHASLTFQVNHLSMSNYTARFAEFDATLELDPANPAAAKVTATIDTASLDLPRPPAGFKATLLSADWLNAALFPEITFRSTAVELTGPKTARITGDLALHGITQPVVMEATFNGGYAGHPYDPAGSRIGFSAAGTLQRSAFGVAAGIPAPGSILGVSDEVRFAIEAEFTRPAPSSAAAQP